MNRWTSTALHEELASYYLGFRGVTAPENTYTQSLWNKIAEVESVERSERASRR